MRKYLTYLNLQIILKIISYPIKVFKIMKMLFQYDKYLNFAKILLLTFPFRQFLTHFIFKSHSNSIRSSDPSYNIDKSVLYPCANRGTNSELEYPQFEREREREREFFTPCPPWRSLVILGREQWGSGGERRRTGG